MFLECAHTSTGGFTETHDLYTNKLKHTTRLVGDIVNVCSRITAAPYIVPECLNANMGRYISGGGGGSSYGLKIALL